MSTLGTFLAEATCMMILGAVLYRFLFRRSGHMYCWRREMLVVHEYIVDAEVTRKRFPYEYARLLIDRQGRPMLCRPRHLLFPLHLP